MSRRFGTALHQWSVRYEFIVRVPVHVHSKVNINIEIFIFSLLRCLNNEDQDPNKNGYEECGFLVKKIKCI